MGRNAKVGCLIVQNQRKSELKSQKMVVKKAKIVTKKSKNLQKVKVSKNQVNHPQDTNMNVVSLNLQLRVRRLNPVQVKIRVLVNLLFKIQKLVQAMNMI